MRRSVLVPVLTVVLSLVTFSTGAATDIAFPQQQLEGDTAGEMSSVGDTILVSELWNEHGDGRSKYSAISSDGRWVAFASSASNLVEDDNNGQWDIFVRDMETGYVERVSVDSNGVEANQESETAPSISADGRFVAFSSSASNLVEGDTNNRRDVFVHDRQAHETTLVSSSFAGGPANHISEGPRISGNGRFVAYQSLASNLVDEDGDGQPDDDNGHIDVFMYDRQLNKTRLVSVSTGGQQVNFDCGGASISSDGRLVAFYSKAGNLDDNVIDTYGYYDVFIRDTFAETTTMVSVAPGGTPGNESSANPSVSGNGQSIAFRSKASNLVENMSPSPMSDDIFVRDLHSDETVQVTFDYGDPAISGNSHSNQPAISWDGRLVTFYSFADNLVENDTNETADVFVHDLNARMTERVSVDSGGSQAENGDSYNPSISADGRFVAFSSFATDLVPNDDNDTEDVFVRDRCITGECAQSSVIINQIEVVQVVQDFSHTAPLIQGKKTSVRVYLSCTLNCDNFTQYAILTASDSNGQLPGLLTPEEGFVYKAGYHEQRRNLNYTLNFTLPLYWTSGDITFTAYVRDVNESRTVHFQSARKLTVGYVLINDEGFTPSLSSGRKSIASFVQAVSPSDQVELRLLHSNWEWHRNPSCVSAAKLSDCLSADLKSQLNRYNIPPDVDYLFGWLPIESRTDFGGTAGSSDPDWLGGKGRVAFGIYKNTDTDAVTITHEIGHLLGRRHSNTEDNTNQSSCVTRTGLKPENYSGTQEQWEAYVDTDSHWPYVSSHVQEYGVIIPGTMSPPTVESIRLVGPLDRFDYMSYCSQTIGTVWTSPWTYKMIFSEKLASSTANASYDRTLNTQEYLIISGLVFTDTTASLSSSWIVTSDMPQNNPPPGTEYCMKELESSGSVFAQHCFDLRFVDYETQMPTGVDGFTVALPHSAIVSRIQLESGGVVLASRDVSPNAPEVLVISPNGGEGWNPGTSETISWSANDQDGDDLEYDVSYSPDGTNWNTLATGITRTIMTIDTDYLPGGSNSLIRVTASDGINTRMDESDDTFTVAGKAPQISIISPSDSAISLPGNSTWLEADAYDLEDGVASNLAIDWSSNVDGDLGSGSSVLVNLSEGLHTIHAVAVDSDGNQSIDEVEVLVRPSPAPIRTTLQISKSADSYVLTWIHAPEGGSGEPLSITQYEIWQSPDAHFTAYDGKSFLLATITPPESVTPGDPLTFSSDVLKRPNTAYYAVRAVSAEGALSPLSNTVGKFVRPIGPGMNLVSLPLVPSFTGIQNVIGEQLSGATSELYADRIWVWKTDIQDYDYAWLIDGVGPPYDGQWWDGDPWGPSGITLEPGMGFWVQNRHPFTQTLTFVGSVLETAEYAVEIGEGMQLIGSAYPVEETLYEATFAEDGAHGATSELYADRIWYWDESIQDYDYAWLIDGVGPPYDGKWWDGDPWGETSITLRPGVGYWYQRRGTGTFTWTDPSNLP